MKLTLLGSGCCRPDMEHWGPAQLVEVGDDRLLFDCGRGASMRLTEAGFALETISRMFFTHHHYDHNCDFAYFFITSWLLGRDWPLEVIGPRGTEDYCRDLLQITYGPDIDTRRFHPAYPKDGWRFEARDVLEQRLTVEYDGYSIDMVHVLHKSHILDNLAFRINSGGKSLVIVGDTMVCEPLMKLAEGCDLMIHECTFPTERIESGDWSSFHTSPAALGSWAKERGVKKLMLKHYAVQEGVAVDPMVEEVRSTYGSEGLIAGEDLMSVEI